MEEALRNALETLERVGCQGGYCDGPTLEPVDMVTCQVCVTIAETRVALGLPSRHSDDETWEESYERSMRDYMRRCVS